MKKLLALLLALSMFCGAQTKIDIISRTRGTLPVNRGGTGTTAPFLIPGTNISITGTWPFQTINSTGGASVYTNAASYNWTQSPAGTMTASSQATVSLSPCPQGVDGANTWSYVHIGTVGTAEDVLIQGGTCTSGAGSGTILVTPANNHGAGYSIGSSTQGWQEASNAARFAVTNPSGNKQSGVVIGTPGEYVWTAPVTLRSTQQTLDFSGTIIGCNMSAACLFVGDPSNLLAVSNIWIKNFRGRPMIASGTFPMIEDNGQATKIERVSTRNGFSGGTFGNMVQIDGDEAADLSGVDPSLGSPNIRCDSTFCGVVIYAPGPFASNAGIAHIHESNLTLNCGANGIDWRAGNTLKIQNVIIQGQHAFGVRTGTSHGGFGSTFFDNVYMENGSCGNSVGTTGVIAQGGAIFMTGGEGPQATFPVYNVQGGALRQYFVVIHDSVLGVSNPLPIGNGTPNSGTVTVLWPQVTGTNTITYDILATSGTIPNGTALQAVHGATNISGSCSNSICTATDTFATALDSYTVAAATYFPMLTFWPGAIVLTTTGDSTNFTSTSTASLDGTISNIIAETSLIPVVNALVCNLNQQLNALWVSCISGASSGFGATVAATMLEDSHANGSSGMTGRIGIANNRGTVIGPNHIFTLLDSRPDLTMMSPIMRRAYLPGDSYIGVDSTNGSPATSTLAYGTPLAESHYINSNPDGTSWKSRMISAAYFIRVPTYLQNNYFNVTTDFTTAANTSLQTITGLSLAIPVTGLVVNLPFSCHLAYSQATGNAAVAFGIQASANPTNVFATGMINTAAGVSAWGNMPTLSTTTATNIVSGTPSATGTVFNAELHGFIENPIQADTFTIMVSTATSGDAVTVKRGSFCTLGF